MLFITGFLAPVLKSQLTCQYIVPVGSVWKNNVSDIKQFCEENTNTGDAADKTKFSLLELDLLNTEICFEVTVSWGSISFIQEGKVLYVDGLSQSLNEIPEHQKKDDIFINKLAHSCNCICYLTSEGKAKININGWRKVAFKENDGVILKEICCGESFVGAISTKNEAYTIEIRDKTLEKSLKDVKLLMEPTCPKLEIKEICAGKEHILLLTNLGLVLSFGGGSRGQLGHGTVDNQSEPCVIEALQALRVVNIAAGGWHSAAVSDIGDVYCWGWNEMGQLGAPSKGVKANQDDQSAIDEVNVAPVPLLVDLPLSSESVNVVKVSCGSRHTAVITDSGELYTWGWNHYGQLGVGDMLSRDSPTLVDCQGHITKVHCGGWTTVIETRQHQMHEECEAANK